VVYLFLGKYVSDVLEGTGMLDCKTGESSMIIMLNPLPVQEKSFTDQRRCRTLVGKAKLSFIIYSDI